jgi:hypothetical protein
VGAINNQSLYLIKNIAISNMEVGGRDMGKEFVYHDTKGEGEFIRIENEHVVVKFIDNCIAFTLKNFNQYFKHSISEINNAIKQLKMLEEKHEKQEREQVKHILNWYGVGQYHSKRSHRFSSVKSRSNGSNINKSSGSITTHCWKCKEPLSYSNPHCSYCKGVFCPKCGECLCNYMWW